MRPTGDRSRQGVCPCRLAALRHPLDRKMSSHGCRKVSVRLNLQERKAVCQQVWEAGEVLSLLWGQLGCIYGSSPHHLRLPQPRDQSAHPPFPSLPSSPPSVFTTRVIKTSHSVSMRLLQQGSSESGKDPNTSSSSSFLPQKDNPHTSSRRIFTSTSAPEINANVSVLLGASDPKSTNQRRKVQLMSEIDD